jgi:hypothetical protein
MTATPDRSLEQRMNALRKANRVRSARKDWKVQVRYGEVDPREVIEKPPAEFETMKVFNALIAIPKLGRVKVNTILTACRISPSKTLSGISERQRVELMIQLHRHLRGAKMKVAA